MALGSARQTKGLGLWLWLGEEAVDGGLEVDERAEDAAPEPALRELGEEALDRVQPGARGRGEVEGPARVPDQPAPHLRRLVRGVVVEDRVHRLVLRDRAFERVEEADELLVPVAGHVPADDGAVEDVERREQRRRPVPLVVVGHRAQPALLHRQARLGAVERLDLRFLVDAEHHGMRRRIDIEPDDVVQLLGEGRIVGKLEAPPPVRREAMRLPDVLDRRDREPHRPGHGLPRPVRRLVRRRRERQPHDLGDPVVRNRRLAGRAGLVAQEPVHARLHEPLLPAPDASLRLARRRHDRVRAQAVGGKKHDPRAPDMLLRRVAIGDDGLQTLAIGGRDRDGYPTAHDADSHAPPPKGIPGGTLSCQLNH